MAKYCKSWIPLDANSRTDSIDHRSLLLSNWLNENVCRTSSNNSYGLTVAHPRTPSQHAAVNMAHHDSSVIYHILFYSDNRYVTWVLLLHSRHYQVSCNILAYIRSSEKGPRQIQDFGNGGVITILINWEGACPRIFSMKIHSDIRILDETSELWGRSEYIGAIFMKIYYQILLLCGQRKGIFFCFQITKRWKLVQWPEFLITRTF